MATAKDIEVTVITSPIELTNIQKKKVQYLADKGGEPEFVAVYMKMPDGALAAVDPFGRVLWSR